MKIRLIPERCIAWALLKTYSELFDYHDNVLSVFDDPKQSEEKFLSDDV